MRFWSETNHCEVGPADVLAPDELEDYYRQRADNLRYGRSHIAMYTTNEDTAERMYERYVYGEDR